ncbi:helix-turn-helix domain-containing protein [Mangrovimicrobium sediminis]|nr:helix-turn-helix transcriptional regulator [Haliea sp. SAOS-164]
MSQVAALLETLKREMKAAGITYAMAGAQLGLSESSIKRLFSDQHLSLERLEQLCALVGLDITTLVRKMGEERKRIAMLSREQEREVAAHPKLLLVAICVLNRLSFDEIVATYTIGEHECIQLLARLDRLKIIDLLPNNRFRLVVDEDFRWIPDGPIQRFFRREVQPAFLDSNFTGSGEKLLFQSGMLSRAAMDTLQRRMEKLLAEFNEQHQADIELPLEQRFGCSILVAMRAWEFAYFSQFRRQPSAKQV